MNWYKKSSTSRYKIAFQLVERDVGVEGYGDIGHPEYFSDPKKRDAEYYPYILWVIDKEGKIHQQELTRKEMYSTHGYFVRQKIFPSWNQIICAGRYDSKRNITSANAHLSDPADFYNDRKKNYIINKATKILDREFDNPKIVEL